MNVGPARIENAPAIAELIRNSFADSSSELTIYGCGGAARYVADNIRARSLGGDTFYTVARGGHGLFGCAETRMLSSALCLNYIAVAESVRAGGFGSALLRASLTAPEAQDYKTLILDVSVSNNVALEWYRRLGFQENGQTNWYLLPPSPAPGPSRHWRVSGFAQAEAMHSCFGFSQFQLLTRSGDYAVGRLGNEWFRITQPAHWLTGVSFRHWPALTPADACC